MKSLSFLVGLLFVNFCYCYEENLSDCEETIHFNGSSGVDHYFEPKNYLHIPDLRYNYAQEDEILNITLFFKGVSDLSVLLTENKNASDGVVINTRKVSFSPLNYYF